MGHGFCTPALIWACFQEKVTFHHYRKENQQKPFTFMFTVWSELDFNLRVRSLPTSQPSGEAGEAAENSAVRRMAYAKKFSIGIEKCKCKV